MGSVFQNYKPAYTDRQRKYYASKKTNRKVVKHEQHLQIRCADWTRQVLPNVHFRSDTASGGFSSAYEKSTHNRQQSSDSEPDMMIFAARRGYNGLLIELKAECKHDKKHEDNICALKMLSDGRKIRKDDYKIRKKGDWKSLHIENQALCLQDYQDNWGYCARFVKGFEEYRRLLIWYFDLDIHLNDSLF